MNAMKKTKLKVYMDPDGVWRDYSKIVRGVSCLAGVLESYINRSISAAYQQDKLEREFTAILKNKKGQNETNRNLSRQKTL